MSTLHRAKPLLTTLGALAILASLVTCSHAPSPTLNSMRAHSAYRYALDLYADSLSESHTQEPATSLEAGGLHQYLTQGPPKSDVSCVRLL
jgi:hypothetical protein